MKNQNAYIFVAFVFSAGIANLFFDYIPISISTFLIGSGLGAVVGYFFTKK